jgi:hypothetical protein
MLSASAITKRRFEEVHVPLDREVRDLQKKLRALGTGTTASAPIPLERWKAQWAGWPPSKRRGILEAFVERIEVGGGDIDISYLLPDSSESPPKDARELRHSSAPTFENSGGDQKYIRLPKLGQRCVITGLSRAKLYELILPNDRNGFRPPVASQCLRKKGAQRGIRLILLESLMQYLSGSA